MLIKKWRREGHTIKDCAKQIGINQDTIFQWIKRFPEFAEAIKKGKAVYDAEAERALERMFDGYFVDEIIEEINEVGGAVKKHRKKTKRYIPPNNAAIIFYLKCRAGWIENPKSNDAVIKKLEAELERVKAETEKVKLQMAVMRGDAEEVEDTAETDELIYGGREEEQDQV